MKVLKTAALKESDSGAAAGGFPSPAWLPFTNDNNNKDIAARSPAPEVPPSNGGIRRPRLKAAVAANVNEVGKVELGLMLDLH